VLDSTRICVAQLTSLVEAVSYSASSLEDVNLCVAEKIIGSCYSIFGNT
jgi:hypothetical protein